MTKGETSTLVMLKLIFAVLAIASPMITIAAATSYHRVIAEDSLKTRLLAEVIVKSQYKYAKRKGDKFVVSFKGSPFYKDKTIAEGLALCPLLSHQGNLFQIIGKQSTVIYINGRPSMLTGEDLSAYLDTKKVDEVERVEIITMPSGRFADANKSGVINIVTSQKTELGAMAVVNAGITKGHDWGGMVNEMLALSLKEININIFTNYANQKKSRMSESYYGFATNEDTRELSDFIQHGKPLTTTGSLEWKRNNNLLGCSYTFSSLSLDDNYTNSSTNDATWKQILNKRNLNNIWQLYNDLSIGKSTVDFLYSSYNRHNKTNDIYSATETSRHVDDAKHQINNLKLDITLELSDSWKIDCGVSANYLNMSSDFSYDGWKNFVKYKENVWKGYLSTSKDFVHWGYMAGLNFEYTKQVFAGSSRVYREWFPSLNITYKNNWGQFYGQYSKTIDRVPYTSLTLSPVYFSPKSITIGNPNLKPEICHHISFGLNKGNLSLEMFYKKYKNICMQYSYTEKEQIINTYTNLNNEQQYGANISYAHAISTVLFARISVSSYCVNSDVMDIGKNNSWNNYLSMGLAVRPDKKGRFDADIRYWALFPQKERGVEWKNRGSFDMDLNYNIIPSILHLTLSIKDLFGQNFANYSRMYNNVNVVNKNTFDNRKISLTVKYTLSNKTKVGKNQHKSIDGLDRIPIE